MLRIAYFLFFILIVIPCVSSAETKIIFAEHKYVMGDNDSKNDARRMCFLEAKRRVLEKAGTYIESRTEVKDFRLTKDEISAYAAALLKVETIKEEWKFIGENMAILISVKAEVDMNSVENQLAKIKQDTSVQKRIKNQQSRLQELERNVVKLQKQLSTVDVSEAGSLRKERNTVFKEIEYITKSGFLHLGIEEYDEFQPIASKLMNNSEKLRNIIINLSRIEAQLYQAGKGGTLETILSNIIQSSLTIYYEGQLLGEYPPINFYYKLMLINVHLERLDNSKRALGFNLKAVDQFHAFVKDSTALRLIDKAKEIIQSSANIIDRSSILLSIINPKIKNMISDKK